MAAPPSSSSRAGNDVDQPTAEEALRALEPLLGEWTLQARWPDGETWAGSVTFQWLDSKRHLVQRGSLEHPQAPENVSVIGCDAANGTYYQLYTDERGVCRVYEMQIGDGEWRLWREGEPFAQRFTGTFSGDGNTIGGRWEIAEDGSTYVTDFDLIFHRVGATGSTPA